MYTKSEKIGYALVLFIIGGLLAFVAYAALAEFVTFLDLNNITDMKVFTLVGGLILAGIALSFLAQSYKIFVAKKC